MSLEREPCVVCGTFFSVGRASGFRPIGALLFAHGKAAGLDIDGKTVCARCASALIRTALQRAEQEAQKVPAHGR